MLEINTVDKAEHDKVVSSMQNTIDSQLHTISLLQSRITAAGNIIKDADSDDLDRTVAKELAEALGVDLTTEVEYTLDYAIAITLKLPLGVDPDDIDESDFDLNLTYTGEGDMDYAISSTDLTQG